MDLKVFVDHLECALEHGIEDLANKQSIGFHVQNNLQKAFPVKKKKHKKIMIGINNFQQSTY